MSTDWFPLARHTRYDIMMIFILVQHRVSHCCESHTVYGIVFCPRNPNQSPQSVENIHARRVMLYQSAQHEDVGQIACKNLFKKK